MTDSRATRLAEVRARISRTAPLSDEREAMLARYVPLMGAVLALAVELGEA